jgi:hypothetical protein
MKPTAKRNAKFRLALGSNERKPGGANRDRTGDLLLAKQALSQLSYGPRDWFLEGEKQWVWWVWVDLNHRPHAYQACALTN